MDYQDAGANHHEQRYRDRVIEQRHRRALLLILLEYLSPCTRSKKSRLWAG